VTTITLPFAIGEKCWVCRRIHHEDYETCPECLGTKEVTLTLANGESYKLECSGCKSGYDPPRGTVRTSKVVYAPEEFTPLGFNIHQDEVSYNSRVPGSTSWEVFEAKHLFKTEAEAQAECDRRSAEDTAALEASQIYQFQMKRKEYAFSVHYWRGQKRDYLKKLAWIDEKLKALQP
jgi:hypothetical protein